MNWEDELKISYFKNRDYRDIVIKIIESLLKQQRESCANKFSVIPMVMNGFMQYEIEQIKAKIINAQPPEGDKL